MAGRRCCRACGNDIPRLAPPNRMHCKDRCRVRIWRQLRRLIVKLAIRCPKCGFGPIKKQH